MKINKLNLYSKVNFNGHEAKPLETIVVQNSRYGQEEIFKQLDAIASQYKVKVIKAQPYTTPWVQDVFIPTKNKKVTGYLLGFENISRQYDMQEFYPIQKGAKYHVLMDGGNVFFATDKDGKDVIITSFDETEESLIGLEEQLDVDRIIELPKADYHTDLFLTPIGDNKILVANDNLMLKNIEKMAKRISTYIDSNPDDKDTPALKQIRKNLRDLYSKFEIEKHSYINNDADEEAARILQKEGFKVIKVPSRIYECDRSERFYCQKLANRKLNYSNAITFKTKDNETVFITGKSALDEELGITEEISKKVGIGFERAFRNAIKPHIKPENTYFIKGSDFYPISDILYNNEGGLHCMCAEIPKAE